MDIIPQDEEWTDNYRWDRRSKRKFSLEVNRASKIEYQILELWLNAVEREQSTRPSYIETGCDNTGAFLEKATTRADYHVEGYGFIEIKFSRPKKTKYFHLKVRQVKSYIKQKAKILFVNGWSTDNPQYTILTTHRLKTLDERCKTITFKGFGNKVSYRIPITMLFWRSL